MPNFWLAFLLIALLSLWLGWLPPMGRGGPERQSSVIAQAQATVAADRAEMAFAEHELNRYNHLAGVGAGTVQNAQQAKTRIDQATARLANATAVLAAERKQVEILTAQRDAAEGGLKRAQAALELASFQLSYTRIVAPVDGMVGERAVRVGAYVTPFFTKRSASGTSLQITSSPGTACSTR